jgi:cytochrome c5
MRKPFVLFVPVIAFVLYACIVIPATAGSPQATPAVSHATTKNPVTPTAESRARAKFLYTTDCAMCHNDNGDGKTDIAKSMQTTIPDFTNPATLAPISDGQMFDIIRNGGGLGAAKMPPETADRASDTDVCNLVIYLRAFAKH